MNLKNTFIIITMLLICTVWAAAMDNPQGNNSVCGPCSLYGLQFDGPLEYTPYPEPLNVGAQNPGKIYVVYSVIDEESRPWWTQANRVWQAWGPYEYKDGKGYILEFGPQDIVGMTEGLIPYYVEGTAAWLQVENVDYWDKNSYSFCIVPQKKFLNASTTHTPTQTDCTLFEIPPAKGWGRESWFNTSINVGQGDSISITASGTIRPSSGQEMISGPEGTSAVENWQNEYSFRSDWGHESLIARISPSGEPVYIGIGGTITATEKGDLWLGVNDIDPENNDGSFLAEICLSVGTAPVPTTGEETLILDIDTLGAVYNKPIERVYLDLADKTRITKIQTYHWNHGAGTESLGSIMIVDMNSQESDGGYVVSFWDEAYGLKGSGGAPNAYWVVEPDLVLEPGQYEIIDSEPSTWAQNDETGGVGVTKVWGIVES